MAKTFRVLMALALLVSLMAVAAPAVFADVTGVAITSPTATAKVYAHAGTSITVAFTVNTNAAGNGVIRIWVDNTNLLQENVTFVSGANSFQRSVAIPATWTDGARDLKVEARDLEQFTWVSDTEAGAVVVDNTAPTIKATTLVNPKGGEYLRSGSPFTITWNAGDITDTNLGTGPITLYYSTDNGANWVPIASGEANDGSYGWTVPGTPSNTYRVKVVATDLAGHSVEDINDGPFGVYVLDNDPPTVSITAPGDGAELTGDVTVTADAQDAQSGIVEVKFEYGDGTSWTEIDTDTLSPFEVTWNTAGLDGTFLLRATAKNGAGASTVSNAVEVLVDNTAPTATFTDPVDGAFIALPYTLEAEADDGEGSGVAQVVFERWDPEAGEEGDWVLIASDDTEPYEASLAGLADGDVDLRVYAVDNVGLESEPEVINVTIDSTAPVLPSPFLTSPLGGEAWQAGTVHNITWSTRITETNLAGIDIYLSADGGMNWNALALGEANDGSYAWTVAGVPGANYKVRLVARDLAGNLAQAESGAFTIWNVDSTAPQVSLVNPAAGQLLKGTIEIEAAASDAESGIQSVVFAVSTDGGETWTPLGTDTAAPYEASWDSGLYTGPALLRAVAKNGVGIEAEAVVSIAVDNSAPTVTLLRPGFGSTVSGPQYELYAEASDVGSGVVEVSFYYNDGKEWVLIGTDSTAPYAVTWDSTVVADGSVTLSVEAVDLAGNVRGFTTSAPVANRYGLALSAGWQLVSTPVLPYDEDIADVFADLVRNGSVELVTTFVWEDGQLVEKRWVPGSPISELASFADGQGYWVKMRGSDELVILGSWLPVPQGSAVPVLPSYKVYAGWNLIGFTPGADQELYAYDYLGAVADSAQAMFYFDAAAGYYKSVEGYMQPGLGYWLAVSQDGTIYPGAFSRPS